MNLINIAIIISNTKDKQKIVPHTPSPFSSLNRFSKTELFALHIFTKRSKYIVEIIIYPKWKGRIGKNCQPVIIFSGCAFSFAEHFSLFSFTLIFLSREEKIYSLCLCIFSLHFPLQNTTLYNLSKLKYGKNKGAGKWTGKLLSLLLILKEAQVQVEAWALLAFFSHSSTSCLLRMDIHIILYT